MCCVTVRVKFNATSSPLLLLLLAFKHLWVLVCLRRVVTAKQLPNCLNFCKRKKCQQLQCDSYEVDYYSDSVDTVNTQLIGQLTLFSRCWCWGSWLWAPPLSSFSKCSLSLTTSFTQSGTPSRLSEKGPCPRCEPVSSSPHRERPKKCKNRSGTRQGSNPGTFQSSILLMILAINRVILDTHCDIFLFDITKL